MNLFCVRALTIIATVIKPCLGRHRNQAEADRRQDLFNSRVSNSI